MSQGTRLGLRMRRDSPERSGGGSATWRRKRIVGGMDKWSPVGFFRSKVISGGR
jgi:hypothetical protein